MVKILQEQSYEKSFVSEDDELAIFSEVKVMENPPKKLKTEDNKFKFQLPNDKNTKSISHPFFPFHKTIHQVLNVFRWQRSSLQRQ